MLIQAFLILVFSQDIQLSELDLHPAASVRLFAVDEDRLLITHFQNGVLYLIDKKGEVLARYEKQGQGPGELHRHWVLGVTEDQILVCSNNRHIIAFDHSLRLLERQTYPPLPSRLSGYYSYGHYANESFYLRQGRFKPYLIMRIALQNEQWVVLDNHFPTGQTKDDLRDIMRGSYTGKPYAHISGDDLFVAPNGTPVGQDHYQIEVFRNYFQNPGSVDSDLTLTAPLDESFPDYNFFMSTNISPVFQAPWGYIVQFRTLNEADRFSPFIWHDFFDEKGQLIGRLGPRLDVYVVAPINGGAVYFSSDGDDGLRLTPATLPER
jgi:hypothetical protein